MAEALVTGLEAVTGDLSVGATFDHVVFDSNTAGLLSFSSNFVIYNPYFISDCDRRDLRALRVHQQPAWYGASQGRQDHQLHLLQQFRGRYYGRQLNAQAYYNLREQGMPSHFDFAYLLLLSIVSNLRLSVRFRLFSIFIVHLGWNSVGSGAVWPFRFELHNFR